MLPLFPEGGGGCSALSQPWLPSLCHGCEQAWMTPALPGSAGSGAGNARPGVGARPGGGDRPAPFWPSPWSGRAGLFLSLIYNVLDKCE